MGCLVNLICIEAAKEQWARDNKKTNGSSLASADVNGVLAYMKNRAMPVCPQGGVYTFGKIGEKPTCSRAMPGHSL
jgi:hypothetical protein